MNLRALCVGSKRSHGHFIGFTFLLLLNTHLQLLYTFTSCKMLIQKRSCSNAHLNTGYDVNWVMGRKISFFGNINSPQILPKLLKWWLKCIYHIGTGMLENNHQLVMSFPHFQSIILSVYIVLMDSHIQEEQLIVLLHRVTKHNILFG